LGPKTSSSINSINIFPNDDLETICEFAGQFEIFQPSMASDSVLNDTYSINVSEDGEKIELVDCGECVKYIACASIIIDELSFHSNSFLNLFTVYKYVLLLPSCERVFSKMKFVKSKIPQIVFIIVIGH
jgi:hypothetical protein